MERLISSGGLRLVSQRGTMSWRADVYVKVDASI
jgi:hypothetical protein